MLDILACLLLGVAAGVLMGLIPGIHPNMIILIVPLLSSINISPLPLIAFIVAMGVTNTLVDFLPSILLGAPESGNELAVLPGHRMLLAGDGYNAIKLAVIGCVGSVIVVVVLLPLLVLLIPSAYGLISPYMHIFLLGFVVFLVLGETGWNLLVSAIIFIMAGSIGLLMGMLPIGNYVLLFPIFSGLFGVSLLLLQLRQKTKVPPQKKRKIYISRKTLNVSIVGGTIGGIIAGFLPGAGSSEIASVASTTKNHRAFLVSMGALTTANIILSILSLWLIGHARSGLAVAVDQLSSIGMNEVLFIIAVSLVSVGAAAIITLSLAKHFVRFVEKYDYARISKFVIILIAVLTFAFTGAVGLLLLATCTALGIFTNLSGVKRSVLMGVLMVPTMLFYAGL